MYQFTTLAIESWTLYAISISLIFSRLIFRRITLGHFNKFQADDWLAVVVLVPYTASIVLANQVGHAESVTERKYRYVLEEMQIITLWLVKACILVLYWRIFPIGTSLAKRRALQGIAVFCASSFIIIQTSLMLWCQPTEQYWNPTNTNAQCKTYHSHTALSTAFTIPSIILVMLVPVPFIQTPRRILLAILFALGTLVLVFSIVSNVMILTAPQSPRYFYWMTAESSISIIFANLPFLTSFVVTAAPARLRHLSSHLVLSQWPRSRRGSWEFSDAESTMPPYRSARLNSSATAVNEEPSALDPINAKTSPVWSPTTPDLPTENIGSPGHSRVSSQSSQRAQSPLIPDPVMARRPDTRDSEVPRMRQSGGLAEMGELSAQDTQGWPIYWR